MSTGDTSKATTEAYDYSMLSAFRKCQQRFQYQHETNWQPVQRSPDLHAGGAVAAGLQVMRETFYLQDGTVGESIDEGRRAAVEYWGEFESIKANKTLERVLQALVHYAQTYPLSHSIMPLFVNGKPGIELNLQLPLNESTVFTGNIDFAYFDPTDTSKIFVIDDKTTSSLGDTWKFKWPLHGQLIGYSALLRTCGVRGTIATAVRGICMLKTKCTIETVHIPPYSDWLLRRWLEQTELTIAQIKECRRTGKWNYVMDGQGVCGDFGGCIYAQACLEQEPFKWLPTFCERRKWDPVSKKEIVLESGASFD